MDDETKQIATATEIRQVFGDIEDAVINSIMQTGAPAAEVEQAAQWFRDSGRLEDEAGHEPYGAVRTVYEILHAKEPEEACESDQK